MSFSLNRPTIMATAVVAVLVASQSPATAAPGPLQPARYDAGRKAIVVPYAGDFPTYFTDSLAGPPRVYFDFDAPAGFTGVPNGRVSGHPSLASWAMAGRGAGKTRLTLTFNRATKVIVLNDKARKQILLVPDVPGATTIKPPAPTPRATPKPRATPAASSRTRTFRQTFGQTDFNYTVGPRPAGAQRDSVDVGVRTSGVTDFHVTSEPDKDFVSFSISIQGKPAATPTPLGTPLPAATPTPLPTPQALPTPLPMPATDDDAPPALPTPQPEETPAPLPTTEPEPTPEPDAPATEPVVIEAPAAGPGSVLSLWGDYYLMGLSEVSPSANWSSADTLGQGLNWEAKFGSLAYVAGLSHLKTRVTDQQVQNATAHIRDEYEIQTGFGFRLTPGGTDQMIGVGVLGRYLANENVVADSDAAIGPPAEVDSILTAPASFFVGPTLFGRLELPLFGPLGVEATGGVSPYMVGLLSPSAEGLSGMLGYWASPSLYLRFGGFQLSGGYALTSYSATNYEYTRSGPRVRVDLRF